MTTVPLKTADRFSSVTRQMGQWMERVMGPEFHRFHPGQAWRPSVNLYEDASAYYLAAELPGIEPGTIDLHVEKGRVVIQGERPCPRPPAGQCGSPAEGGAMRLHLMEVDYGPFYRALDLPDLADPERVEACYRHGFLWIRMPKLLPRRGQAPGK